AMQSPAADRSTRAALQTSSQTLYQALMAPLAPSLDRYRRLIIAADGLLYYLPFEALGSARKTAFHYLIEDHEVSYVPSATALGELLRRPRNRVEPVALLALGDPDFHRKEAAGSERAWVSDVSGLYNERFRVRPLPLSGEE